MEQPVLIVVAAAKAISRCIPLWSKNDQRSTRLDQLRRRPDDIRYSSLKQVFSGAIYDPDVFGFTWLMLVRTRWIDELMERAIRGGATQLVILGAGLLPISLFSRCGHVVDERHRHRRRAQQS